METRKLLSFISILLLLIVSLPPPLYSQGRVAGEIIMTRGLDTSTGDIFFVDDSGSNDNNCSVTTPCATLDHTIGRTTANVGDTIFLMEGHAETLIAADAVDVDVAGIKIIGLGTGNLRATFTMATSAAAEINIDAANVYLANIIIVDNIACTACIELTANADGFHADNILIREGSQQPAIMIDMVGQADDVLIENSTFLVPTADTGAIGIDLSALTPARFTFRNNVVRGDFNTAALFGSGALTDAAIHDNVFNNLLTGQFAVEFSAASLGYFKDNLLSTDLIATALDPGSLATAGNMWTDAVGTDARAQPIPEYSDFFPGLGYRVTKQLDWETDPDVLFTVTGLVAITLFVGEITTVCSASCDTLIETAAGTVPLMAVSAMDTLADGGIFIITGDQGGLLNGGDAPVLIVAGSANVAMNPIIIGGAGDSVTIQNNPGTTDTGQATLYLFYIPLSPGATVVPA